MRTLAMCACALALTTLACSNGDGNGDGTPPVCGNNQCEAGETCTNCSQDCGCPAWRNTCLNGECIGCGDKVCNGDENCATCESDCGCREGEACYPTENTCRPVSTNPLIDAIPGTWDLLEVNGMPPQEPMSVMLTTDTRQPLCGYDPPPVGDACVRGFSGPSLFLDGTRLHDSKFFLDGHVLNDGTRIEWDYSDGVVVENDAVWVKRE